MSSPERMEGCDSSAASVASSEDFATDVSMDAEDGEAPSPSPSGETPQQSGYENEPTEPVSPVADNSTRCKLYRHEEASWVAVGVGQAVVETATGEPTASGGPGGRLILVDEENPDEALITHNLDGNGVQNYSKQQDTLILFTNTATKEDYGLSFEKPEGCQAVWDALVLTLNGKEEGGSEVGAAAITLPPATLAELPELAQVLEALVSEPSTRSIALKEQAALIVLQQNYLTDLFALFKEAEAAGQIATLHCIFRIIRTLLVLNCQDLTKEMLTYENLINVIGCFEYSPERPDEHIRHRDFLENTVFRNPLQLNQGLQENIKQHFLVQYLRETVAASILDDAAYDCLNNTMIMFRIHVLRSIARDEDHMVSLCQTMTDPGTSTELRETLLLMTQEMVITAKSFPLQHRNDFFDFLIRTGILRSFVGFVEDGSDRARAAVSDILWQIAKYNVNYLRQWSLMQKADGCPLLRALFRKLILETVEGIQHHWADIITFIVKPQPQAPDTFSGNQVPEMPAGFINILYKQLPMSTTREHKPLIEILGVPIDYHPYIFDEDPSTIPEEWRFLHQDVKRANAVLFVVIPIISCCLSGHTARMSTFLLSDSIPKKVCSLLNQVQGRAPLPSYVILSIFSFLKALISSSDEMVFRNIVRHKMLEPVFALLARNTRYTLLNSSALSIVSCIAKEDCRTLIRHVTECYAPVLERPQYSEVKEMIEKRSKESSMAVGMKRSHGSTLPKHLSPFHSRLTEDDDYFNQEMASTEEMDDTSTMSSESDPKRHKPGD